MDVSWCGSRRGSASKGREGRSREQRHRQTPFGGDSKPNVSGLQHEFFAIHSQGPHRIAKNRVEHIRLDWFAGGSHGTRTSKVINTTTGSASGLQPVSVETHSTCNRQRILP